MPLINANILKQPIKRAFKPGSMGQFWLTQSVVIASTIVGVYLAASVGLMEALRYEQLVNQRDLYYMNESLKAELDDNLQSLEQFIADLKNPEIRYVPQRRPDFSNYIWNVMGESSVTFQVPAKIITGVRRYHQKVDDLLDKLDNKIFSKDFVRKSLEQQATRLRKDVFPVMATLKSDLQKQLQRYEIIKLNTHHVGTE